MNSDFTESLIARFVEAFEGSTEKQLSGQRHTEVPFQAHGRPGRLDLLVSVEGVDLRLAAEILRVGYPRDIRNAVWRLEEYRLSLEDASNTALFVIAEQLSAGAREILRERNIGYFDASGSLYLKHKDWLINIDRLAKPGSPRRAESLFTGAREQVIHALLHSHQKWLTGLEIASLAETSAYTVSLTLQELERRELLESKGSGRTLRRRLAQPGVLLDLWADAWRVRKEHKTRWFAYTHNPKAMLLAIADKLEREALRGWAFTSTAAANAVSPLLTHVESAEIIVPPGSAPDYAKALGLQEVEKGSNVTLIERSGASSLFTGEHSDPPSHLASAFIMYLDLLDGRGRNKELASQLRSDILKI